jgi:hypothetical protein
VSFQPSTYSYDQHYDGWFMNLFTREGRAENKLNRAEEKRLEGDEKAARKLEDRAAVLKARARGKDKLSPQSATYKELWEAKEPWATRMRLTGAGLDGTARGYQPAGTQRDGERRAVIVGGVMALNAAGIAPWDALDPATLPQKMLQSKELDVQLVKSVRTAAGKKRKELPTLREAAEYVRAEVIKHDLSAAAWSARALIMLASSITRSKITQAAAGATSAGTATAAGIVAVSGTVPPWIQSIATAPAAGVLAIISAVSAAVGAGAQIENVRAVKDAEKYGSDFAYHLDAAGYRVQARTASADLSKAMAQTAYKQELAQRVGEAQAATWVNGAKAVAWAGGISFAIVLTAFSIRTVRTAHAGA